ncbi:MAG: DUF2079 domain-containing protein [Chloroflexaceae bacterium]
MWTQTLLRWTRPTRLGPVRIDWLMLVLATLIGGALCWVSLTRYNGYRVWMQDLGNMAQAIWSVTQGHPLEFTYITGNVSRLSLHAEFFYFLLVPLYALLPDPRTLLVFQALLFTLGAWPAYRMGLRATDSWAAARVVALIYLCYPVAQSAVLFDFHGDTLALPLLLFALDALEARAWRWYTFWTVLALMSKMYVAVPVAIVGLLLLRSAETRRAGLLTTAGAGLYFLFVFVVIRSLFAPPDTFGGMGGVNAYLQFYFDLAEIEPDAIVVRLLYALVVFGPALLLTIWHWPRLLPGLIVALAALISTRPDSASIRSAHYAMVVPFIIWAVVATLPYLWRQRPLVRWMPTGISLVVCILLSSWLAQTLLLQELQRPHEPPRDLTLRSRRDYLRDRWLADITATHIPADAPVAASLFFTPRLLHRETLFLTRFPGYMTIPPGQPERNRQVVDYAVTDALFDYRGDLVAFEYPVITAFLRDPNFGLVAAQDGLLLFQRDAAPAQTLDQELALLPHAERPPIAYFDDKIGLLAAELQAVGDRQYRLQCDWIALTSLADVPQLIAVSRLVEVGDARVVHLPTLALHPTTDWSRDQVVRETFEFTLPPDIPAGTYEMRVGWYDTGHAMAAQTGAASRVGTEEVIATITVP